MDPSSSSSTLSNPPSYPGLHSVALLQPKSPGSHSAREDAATWDAWRSEIQELVDFLLTEAPPSSLASPKRSSRELLRSGSKHLRQSLRGRPLRNTWGSRQLRSLMGKQEQRFCHIVQDPEFLKDMADPGMYLINCNARALGRGLAERNSKGSADWKTLRVSDISNDHDPDATLCGIPEPPRVPRVLSKRLPLSSHPSRGHTVTIRANKDHTTTQPQHKTRASTPRMQGAASTGHEHDAILPEVPTTAFDPFAPAASEPPVITRKPVRVDPPKVTTKLETSQAKTGATVRSVTSRDHLSVGTPTEPGTDITPASSIVHLPPVPPTPHAEVIRRQRSFPVTGIQDSPTSTGTAPFLSLKGSREDGFLTPCKTNSDEEALTAPNKPWLESGLTPKQPWRLRENSYTPPTRIPAPFSSAHSTTATIGSDTKSNYAAAQNIWSANAALARRRMATRIDTTRRLKQRDFERARVVRDRKMSDANSASEKRSLEADSKPPGTSHSTHSEPVFGKCDVTSLPQPRTMRLQRAISYDGHEEAEPATSKALDWYAKSPERQTNPWNSPSPEKICVEKEVTRALSPVYTVAERAPSPARRKTQGSARRTTYRSRGTQCCLEAEAQPPRALESDPAPESQESSLVRDDMAPSDASSSPEGLARLETKLDAQLAHMDQRTKMLESLLLSFVRKAASRETLGWDALSKAAATTATMTTTATASGTETFGGLGRINEAGTMV